MPGEAGRCEPPPDLGSEVGAAAMACPDDGRVLRAQLWQRVDRALHVGVTGSARRSRGAEPPTEGVDHLLAAVADPLLAQPLPADLRIKQPRRSFEIAAPKRAEEVEVGAKAGNSNVL
jgi:hypothetical protein